MIILCTLFNKYKAGRREDKGGFPASSTKTSLTLKTGLVSNAYICLPSIFPSLEISHHPKEGYTVQTSTLVPFMKILFCLPWDSLISEGASFHKTSIQEIELIAGMTTLSEL
jgi:hypothetical protein